ncbi:leucine-rich_repeat domain-containing protein [Hexamita inflata]|uniref:Leucine-rich repeat domain-containing protein n=1 Tax=Hexamita inflata TaxID=28002 RepID=A0AA86Q472_9EUKA|nr:leucine-rich repeat domain-containing protein [Hexamita inflata]
MIQHFHSHSDIIQSNNEIESKEGLLNHFGSSQQLEILDSEQMKNLLDMDIPPEVWEDASSRNLLSFSQEFVQQTKQFSFVCRKIEHIQLISFLTNLTELSLYNNKISDISSISKLKNLKKLYLYSNYIEDISALQSLLNLTHLYLSYNKLTSYTLTLPNLVELELSCNMLQDKFGQQHSPKLEILNLFKTETTDLHTIPHQLFCLKELYLSSNNLTQISYLSNFVDLQNLYLNCNKQLQNIGPLKFCTQLTELNISETSVADIWSLQYMKNLKILHMNEIQVIDLHSLQNLCKLETIYAYDAYIIDVSPLSKLTQLKELYFSENQITNAETLQHHLNFSRYDFSDQYIPTTDELKFYNKILSVHNSHKSIRKIQAENKISKFRESITHQRECIILQINERVQVMNMKIEIWAQFIQNSNADQ